MTMAQPYTIKSGDPRNDVTPAAPKGYSTFDLSHRFLQTHRFGELSPHCSFEVIKGDRDSMRLMNDTSSYSLKSPVKMDMFQKRSNFFVPLQAIIRNNWELITSQPVSGDDAPENADGVVTAVQINSFLDGLVTQLGTISSSDPADGYAIKNYLTDLVRNLLVAEMFFSQGSLCKQLYYDFSHCFKAERTGLTATKTCTFDAFAEHIWSALAPGEEATDKISNYEVSWYDEDNNVTDSYSIVSDKYLLDNPTIGYGTLLISFRHFLDLARQNLNFKFTSVTSDASIKLVSDGGVLSLYSDAADYLFGDFYDSGDGALYVSYQPISKDLNFDRISAYQIVAAHFFSLDYVDYIYSAELYRQLMQYYFDKCCLADSIPQTFTWNGLDLNYDPLSGYAINECAFKYSYRTPFASTTYSFSIQDAYLTALFSFRHSLRYLDYFTGGRTQPLSVGASGVGTASSVDVAVVDSKVSSVDMILAQNAARYLNFAQRAGRKISQWLDKLLPGGVPKPDMHDPQWLSTTGDALNPEQVQNTGSAQATEAQSITARFKADSNQYVFTVSPDRPGYVICITYYDIPRAYAFATDKENMHCNRYDRFNPFMQYNGSQIVDKQEIGLIGDTPFSYQNRYEEYKQKYDVAAGGFVENLPGFAFIADLQSGLPMQSNLNPTYVRSWNCELDPFYLALTGYGLAAYFHFIVKNVNIIKGVRPMEYAPQLM